MKEKMNNKIKKIKLKWKNIILILIFLILFITLNISIYNIIKWKLDSNKTNEEINTIQENTNIEEVKDNKGTEIIKQAKKIPKENPYWDYIKMNMIDVNFDNLKKINSDVVGWIKVNGTNINYPFVQSKDNKYYLTHSFNKSYNNAGWVFLDYRNNNINNRNTIIYAHGRTDKTMFGTLRKVLNNGWINNTNNYVIKISTEKENSLWQIFSIYHIPTTNDYLQTEFKDEREYQRFLNILKNRSNHNFNTSITSNDTILTLSTCYNDSEKMVVHAKLIKKQKKY
ncbi:srtB family sortase [Clostridium sp. CAG:710]|jgi:sortase, srtB family|nr:srtB family sortase [Clostridium sp. CAG:710]